MRIREMVGFLGREDYGKPEWYEILLDYIRDGRINAALSYISRKGMDAGEEPLLRQLLDSNKWMVLRDIERSIGREFDGFANTAEMLDILRKAGIEWPELSTFWDDNKTTVMRLLLQQMASKDPDAALFAWQELNALAQAGVHWPEFDAIRRSIDAELRQERREVDEAGSGVNLSNMATRKLQKAAEQGFEDLKHYGSRWISHLRSDLHRNGANDAMVADIFNMNKDKLLYTIGRDFSMLKDMHAVMAGIQQCRRATGITWPEIKHLVDSNIHNIKTWVDWYLDRHSSPDILADIFHALQDIGMDAATLKEMKKRAIDHMLKDVKDTIRQFGFNRMALAGIESLEKMGVKVNLQDPRTQARMAADLANKLVAVGLSRESLDVVALMLRYGGDGARDRLARLFDDNKVPIMRGMLLLIKGNNMYSVLPAYTALRNLGIRWPELEIIRDTLEKDIGPHALAEMRGGGARMMADHIARKMASQIAAGDDTGVGYTMQGLDRIDRDVATAALEPISDDIARWVRRLVHDHGSPAFAVHELSRLASYTDGLDPRVQRALDDARDPIIKAILTLVRDQHEDEAGRLVGKLRFLNAQWPQLKVIAGSLLEDDDGEGGFGHAWYGKAWRDNLEAEEFIREIVADIRHPDNHDVVALTLADLGDLDVEPTLPVSTRQLISGSRDIVIKSILRDLVRNPGSKRMLRAILALNNMGFNWPQLDTIYNSLSASKAPGDAEEIDEDRVNPQAAVNAWYKRFMRQIGEDDDEELVWSLIMMGRFDAPIGDDIDTIRIDRHKDGILRNMLKALANKLDMGLHVAEFEQREMLAGARKLGLDWPELDTIEQSLSADRQVDESDEHDEYLGQLLRYLKSYLLDRRYGEMFELLQEIACMDGVPHDMKALLDRNKDGILKRMLEFIKYSAAGTYLSPQMAGFDAQTTIDGLRSLGVDWPELNHVRRSLRADRQIGEANLPAMLAARQLAMVRKHPDAIAGIPNPSERVQIEAVSYNGYAIANIANPSEAVQLAAVERNGDAIQYIENPSDAVRMAAVANGASLSNIKDPTDEMKLAAVQKWPSSIRDIRNPSEDLQVLAVSKNPSAIYGIMNPTLTVQLMAMRQPAGMILNIRNIDAGLWKDKRVRDKVIKRMLRDIRDDHIEDATRILDHLRKNNCPWPELGHIERSLRAEGEQY